MKFKIGSPIQEFRPTNCFQVEVKTMMGDGDLYRSFFREFNEDKEQELENFINLLDEVNLAYPNGMGGCDDFYHIEGFEEELGEDWGYCSNYGIWDSARGYNITYFNNEGYKFAVDIIK
jgi:hypothetical protein